MSIKGESFNVHQTMNKYKFNQMTSSDGIAVALSWWPYTPTPPSCLTVHMSMCTDDPSSTPCKDCAKLSMHDSSI